MDNVDLHPGGDKNMNINKQEAPEYFSSQVVEARRFYRNHSPAMDGDLSVVCAGYEKCSPGYQIDRQTFPYFSLEFVSHGSGDLDLAGKKSRLTPGVIFSYGPGVSQRISSDSNNPVGKYFVNFAGRRSADLLASCGLAPGGLVNITCLSEIQTLLDQLIHDGGSEASNSGKLCRMLLEYLFERINTSRKSSAVSQSQAEKTYERCRNHLFENCTRLMTLEAAAKECKLDKAYMCRLFRRFNHQTPYQYLMKQKMHQAAVRLENSELRVNEVSALLGYTDPFLFSRAFKSVFGISPTDFRRLRG